MGLCLYEYNEDEFCFKLQVWIKDKLLIYDFSLFPCLCVSVLFESLVKIQKLSSKGSVCTRKPSTLSTLPPKLWRHLHCQGFYCF